MNVGLLDRPSGEASSPPGDPKALVPAALPPIASSAFADIGPPRTPLPQDGPNNTPNATSGPADGAAKPASSVQLPTPNGDSHGSVVAEVTQAS
jgi:hypothetical protein